MAEKEIIEFPKMLYRMGKGNVLENKIVGSQEEQDEAGKEWKESIPKPRGRPAEPAQEAKDDE